MLAVCGICSLIGGASAAWMLSGGVLHARPAQESADVIQADKIQILDGEGNVVVELGHYGEALGGYVKCQDRAWRTTLGASRADGAWMSVRNDDLGKSALISLSGGPEESAGEAALQLNDQRWTRP